MNIVLFQNSKTNKEPVKVKLRFTILGQVKKPGNHEIQEGEKVSIVQAIAIAEGFIGVSKLFRNVPCLTHERMFPLLFVLRLPRLGARDAPV